MLKLVGEAIGDVVEAAAGRAVALGCAWGGDGIVGAVLLVGVGVVVEVALVCDAACALLGTPDLLLAVAVGEGLWEGGRGGGEGTALLAGEGLLVVEAEVEVQPVGVGVAAVLLALLLLVVCHRGGWLRESIHQWNGMGEGVDRHRYSPLSAATPLQQGSRR